jgi:hypothetical protein
MFETSAFIGAQACCALPPQPLNNILALVGWEDALQRCEGRMFSEKSLRAKWAKGKFVLNNPKSTQSTSARRNFTNGPTSNCYLYRVWTKVGSIAFPLFLIVSLVTVRLEKILKNRQTKTDQYEGTKKNSFLPQLLGSFNSVIRNQNPVQ